MTKATTKKKAADRADVTVQHDGETFTLLMGTAAFLQLEIALGRSLAEMGDVMAKPSLSTLRDLIAAALIEHHPQAENATTGFDPTADVMRGFHAALGVDPSQVRPTAHWPAQQALANRIMDSVGMEAAADLIQRAVEASPHLQSAAE